MWRGGSLFIMFKAHIQGTSGFGLLSTDIDLTETEFPSKEVGLCNVDGHNFFCGLKLVRA